MAKKSLLKNIGFQILIAMILGTVIGIIMGEEASIFAPLGTVFIHLIKMLVIPLIVISIISGAANLSDSPSAGKVGIGTIVFFLATSAIAVALALLAGEIFKPGVGLDLSSVHHMFSNQYADKGELPSAIETVIGMIPTNIFQSLLDANILQILVFCLFFGIALSKVPKEKSAPIMNSLEATTQALIWMVTVVMLLAPIGVFGLMADSVGTYGFEMLKLVGKLFLVYMGALLVYGYGFYPLLIKLFSKMPILKFLSAMKKPQIVALSTASSMATLPVNMKTCEEELKISKSTCSFVLPLGATINMSGNAIYYGLVAIFFAQVYNIDLGLGGYVAIIFTATIGAIGQAGVPGPSFLVVAVLIAAGIPIEGLPLLIALDRMFDMTRTALNITGDAACAVIIDNYNTKKDKLEAI
ncbi:sodium:dicarboxylate symporter [Arcobacter nitrofigilis DSM 7299]|uniref:Sodium:dicarboxylate symporter n=1 Tax=Arcobacter nitrofigilis (strain ATCC 33309 / DSM 7299 / CCUG 15893 / LMG 7604 / NCTC 12251 / CI) TaxID=572480 RepID=D5V030_ARCNC|nr:dicarboxylate/amino acid:cation symporter [Arcobacter nitrofigilis]ADG93642.1 sodium:dicarboxylate symporter [Arcobacter nitrofigilis DSM 7299]